MVVSVGDRFFLLLLLRRDLQIHVTQADGVGLIKGIPGETLREDWYYLDLYKTRHENVQSNMCGSIIFVFCFAACQQKNPTCNEDFSRKDSHPKVFSRKKSSFQELLWCCDMVKIAPGTCESRPSWCWKRNWRGAANFPPPFLPDGWFWTRCWFF